MNTPGSSFPRYHTSFYLRLAYIENIFHLPKEACWTKYFYFGYFLKKLKIKDVSIIAETLISITHGLRSAPTDNLIHALQILTE